MAISRMKKPVIAQVHGVAAANGMGLVAAADLAIAASNTKMGLTAINVGLNCVGPIIPVARCVGRKKALELLLFGELIKAPEAQAMGLLNRVVDKEVLESETQLWAETLVKKSPLAIQIAQKGFYTSEDMEYHRQFDLMNEAFGRLCTTRDAKEGIQAFFGKTATALARTIAMPFRLVLTFPDKLAITIHRLDPMKRHQMYDTFVIHDLHREMITRFLNDLL